MLPLVNSKKVTGTILVLRELRELSYEEIAQILNCTLGRVKSRLHEARKALRQELERIDW